MNKEDYFPGMGIISRKTYDLLQGRVSPSITHFNRTTGQTEIAVHRGIRPLYEIELEEAAREMLPPEMIISRK